MSPANSIVDVFSLPDIVLPSQHFDSRTRCLEPEKQPYVSGAQRRRSVLSYGVCIGQGPRHRLFADAAWWLFRAEGRGLFSVQYICDALDIDPSRLRSGVLCWRDRELAGEASRMIRRPPVLTAKQASGSASMSRRENKEAMAPRARSEIRRLFLRYKPRG